MNGCYDNGNGMALAEISVPDAVAVNPGGDSNPGRIRIWLVDDNCGFRTLLASILNAEIGIECSRQFSSPEGVLEALASEEGPDVILLDIEMGTYNGLDAVGPIKLLAPNTRVLMLTTMARPGSRERAYREGASDFMLKSWTVVEMVRHIRQAMEFGCVPGFLAAFTRLERTMAKPEPMEVAHKATAVERGIVNLRNLFKFSPAR